MNDLNFKQNETVNHNDSLIQMGKRLSSQSNSSMPLNNDNRIPTKEDLDALFNRLAISEQKIQKEIETRTENIIKVFKETKENNQKLMNELESKRIEMNNLIEENNEAVKEQKKLMQEFQELSMQKQELSLNIQDKRKETYEMIDKAVASLVQNNTILNRTYKEFFLKANILKFRVVEVENGKIKGYLIDTNNYQIKPVSFEINMDAEKRHLQFWKEVESFTSNSLNKKEKK